MTDQEFYECEDRIFTGIEPEEIPFDQIHSWLETNCTPVKNFTFSVEKLTQEICDELGMGFVRNYLGMAWKHAIYVPGETMQAWICVHEFAHLVSGEDSHGEAYVRVLGMLCTSDSEISIRYRKVVEEVLDKGSVVC